MDKYVGFNSVIDRLCDHLMRGRWHSLRITDRGARARRMSMASALAIGTLAFSPSTAPAQRASSIQWQRCLGGSDYDIGASIQPTRDGGYIVAGTSFSSDSQVTGHHPADSVIVGNSRSGDYWVVKLDIRGAIEWQRSFGGMSDEWASHVIQTLDGSYVIAGWSSSNDGDVTGNTTGSSGFMNSYGSQWIVKLDVTGALVWQRILPLATGEMQAVDVAEMTDGSLLVAGATRSGYHSYSDYALTKLDAQGSIIWSRSIGGTGNERARSVRITPDGGFIVAGFSNSFDGDVVPRISGSTSGMDFWVVKISGDSTIQWQRSLGGFNNDMAMGVCLARDGGFVIAGWTDSYNDGDVVGGGDPAAWMVKLSATGGTMWTHSFDVNSSGGESVASDVQQTLDGGFVVFCAEKETGGEPPDYLVLWLDSAGTLTGSRRYGGGSEEDYMYNYEDWKHGEIRCTPDSGYIFVGTTQSNDGDASGNHGAADIWVVKLGGQPIITSTRSFGTPSTMCGGVAIESLWVYDVGDKLLKIDSVTIVDPSQFSIVSPALPVSIPPLDSVLFIVRVALRAAGGAATRMSFYSNDPLPADRPWIVNVRGRMDSVGYVALDAPADTVRFGDVRCATGADTVFRLHSTSTIPTSFSLSLAGSPLFSLSTASAVFPQVGGEVAIRVHFAGSVTAGAFGATLTIVDTCGRATTLAITALVNSSPVVFTPLPELSVCPGDSLVRTITVRNTSVLPQRLLFAQAAGFRVAPDSVTLPPGDSAIITIVFAGSATVGDYTASYALPGCGGAAEIAVVVHVELPPFTADATPDTTVCPGVTFTKVVKIRNVSTKPRSTQLVAADLLFSIAPSGVTVAGGDSTTVTVTFRGDTITGTHTLDAPLPSCSGDRRSLAMTVRVVAPQLGVASRIDTMACPFTPLSITVRIDNRDSVARAVMVNGSTVGVSRPGLTILAGSSDTVTAFVAARDTGTYVDTVTIVDECGVQHQVSIRTEIRALPPLMLGVVADAAPSVIGVDRTVWLVASPRASLAMKNVTVVIANEATALQCDRVMSPFDPVVTIASSSVALQFPSFGEFTSIASDTIAALQYRTLVGTTLTPSISVQSAATASVCDRALAAGSVTLSLTPPGCELGTVRVHPFTSGIQTITPNPVTGNAVIGYTTVERAQIRMDLCNALGRPVRTVFDNMHDPGAYATTLSTAGLPKGVYYLTMRGGAGYVGMRVMVVE